MWSACQPNQPVAAVSRVDGAGKRLLHMSETAHHLTPKTHQGWQGEGPLMFCRETA